MGFEGWAYVVAAGILVLAGVTYASVRAKTARPLPALDRTPRTATVTEIWEPDDERVVMVTYAGADGHQHRAGIADLIGIDELDRFAPGTRWQIYDFRVPNGRVLLTEDHDDITRRGYNLDGIRLGAESGPVDVGPRSRFLYGGWKFADD